LSNRLYKNYQVNVGLPFEIKPALNFQTIRHMENEEDFEDKNDSFDEAMVREEIIREARIEADMIIQEAKYEAARIIEDAERSSKESYSAMVEEARIKGYEDGLKEVKKQYEDLLTEAEYIREHARIEYNDVLSSIESDAVNIILDIAKKVVGNELSTNKENIMFLIRQAFEKCANKENIVLKVSPDDYEYICENKDSLLAMVEGIGELDIKKEPSLKSGGCIVETPLGSIDASLQTKFKKIEESFRELIKR